MDKLRRLTNLIVVLLLLIMGTILIYTTMSTSLLAQGEPSEATPETYTSKEETIYVDPLYGYELHLEDHWNVAPTAPDAVYGAAVLRNYDEYEVEKTGVLPEDAIKIQISVAPLWDDWTFEDWARGWRANEVIHGSISTEMTAISFEKYSGVSFSLEPRQNQSGQTINISELLLDIGEGQIMTMIFYSPASNLPAIATQNIKLLDVSKTKDFPKSLDLFESPSLSTLLEKEEEALNRMSTSIEGLCSTTERLSGDDAPSAPFTLHMPFKSGQTWQVGWKEGEHGGSFYGNNYHCNQNGVGDHYATDWNRYEEDEDGNRLPEVVDVFPVAAGTIANSSAFPACSDSGGDGCQVLIDHNGSNVRTRYAHLSNIYRLDGDVVNHWERIGKVGDTGNGPTHLHCNHSPP